MKNPVVYLVILLALSGGGVSYAQKPVDQKPAAQAASRETRQPEDKREELSKKLLQRKNELRKEEHNTAKDHHNTDVKEKAPESKKN